MTVDPPTIQWALAALGAAIGGAWAYFRWLDARFDRQRQAMDIARTEIEREIESLRNECVRREELAQILATMHGLTARVDAVLLAMRTRVTD